MEQLVMAGQPLAGCGWKTLQALSRDMGWQQSRHDVTQGKQPELGQLERFPFLPTLKYK